MQNQERAFPLTDHQVRQASEALPFNAAGAVTTLEALTEVDPDLFGLLTPHQQRLTFMAARVIFTGTHALAKREDTASQVKKHLMRARTTIVEYYRNPHVLPFREYIKTDTAKAPYDFDTEMQCDEAEYLLTLGTLTGNTIFLDQAIKLLDHLARNPEVEQTAHDRVIFRLAQVMYTQKPNYEAYEQLQRAERAAVKSNSAIGRWERQATISARFIVESMRRPGLQTFLGGAQGLWDFIQAWRHDLKLGVILPKEIGKHAAQKKREQQWQKTRPAGETYTSLTLPKIPNPFAAKR